MKPATRRALLGVIGLLILSLTMASSAFAERWPASSLLLPCFELRLDDSVTSLFAVSNVGDETVSIRMAVYSGWGIEVLVSHGTLGPDQVLTINLGDWINRGWLPDRILESEEIGHIRSALCGEASTLTGEYYSSLVDPEDPTRMFGSVLITVEGASRPDVLWGDFFVVDSPENAAQGEVLAVIDPSVECSDLCHRHVLRFLEGGAFDAGTQMMIWSPTQGSPAASPYFPESEMGAAELRVFDEAGRLLATHNLALEPLTTIRVADLGLPADFGWLDLVTEEQTFVSTRYGAGERFSVGLESHCAPLRVGPRPALLLEKYTNEHDADLPPGPRVLVGDPVEWTYGVFNETDMVLTEVFVTDNKEGDVSCPKDVLEPGETMTCTVRSIAGACQYRNRASVTALTPDGATLQDSDPSHYFGVQEAAIDLEKWTNGFDADRGPGPEIPVGDGVIWTYRVANLGATAFTDVSVTDDQMGAISCPKSTLDVGETMTCQATGTAQEGPYANLGTVAAVAPCGETMRATDPSHYTGVVSCPEGAAIELEKWTNGHDADQEPGPKIATGSAVIWTYKVTNGGATALTQVAVTDDRIGAIPCPKTSLAIGETMTCGATGTAQEGPYANVGEVVALGPCEETVLDTDPSHYYGESLDEEGCSPGYWKNHESSWPASGYSIGQRVDSVFNQASAYPALAAATLHEALAFGGGTDLEGAAKILLRAGTAALLNAAHPGVDSPRTAPQVIASVDGALASGNRSSMLSLASSLDQDNNLGCPLS